MRLKQQIKQRLEGKALALLDQQPRVVEDLLCHIMGCSWGELQLQSDLKLSSQQETQFLAAIQRLQAGEPLAYITGEKFFYKNNFYVDQRVLIPRPETELIVEKAVSIKGQDQKIIDIGAGSGCIGLSIALEKISAQVWLVDTSKLALEVSLQNKKNLKVENAQLVHCCVGEQDCPELDVFDIIDIVVANPPYIAQGDERVELSVHQFEPHCALYAKDQGLYWIRQWLSWVYPRLKSGGFFIFEFGKGQQESIAELIAETAFEVTEIIADYSQTPRIFVLKKS